MLPYSTATAAAAALNRTLTPLETLWVRHTAGAPDADLYLCCVAVSVLTFHAVAAPAALLHALRFPPLERHKLQRAPAARASAADLAWCWLTVVATAGGVAAPLALAAAPAFAAAGVRTGLPLPRASEMLLQLAAYFLVEDYAHYWLHRALHSPWAYACIHHVHHRFAAPTVLAAPHAHWAEVVLLGAPTFLGPLAAPGHVVTLWAWVCLRQLEAHHIHCGYALNVPPADAAGGADASWWWWWWWLSMVRVPWYAGAAYHDWHHRVGGTSHTNFASVFTYCDRIYGTSHRRYHKLQQRPASSGTSWSTATKRLQD